MRFSSALCVLVLVALSSTPTSATDPKPLTAILLLARADLPDSNFADSIVLVLNNVGPAPIGIIVNRPTLVGVAEIFPKLKRKLGALDKVYFGGPVELDTVWFLFRSSKPPKHAIQAFEGVCLSADRNLLMQLLGRDKPMEGLRLFLGHSGWAPGQLEGEIAHGDWTLQRADPDAIFKSKPGHPWPAPSGPNDST